MAAPLPDLVLYARPGCGLCDEARALLEGLISERGASGLATPAIDERNIEADPDIFRVMFDRIPVVEFAGRRLELAMSPAKLRRLIADGLDGAA